MAGPERFASIIKRIRLVQQRSTSFKSLRPHFIQKFDVSDSQVRVEKFITSGLRIW